MESSDMKNMVVLKNFPSNIVEEAIIVFKEKQRVREIEKIENGRKVILPDIKSKSRDCVLKEAEMLVTDYINKIEDKKKTKKNYGNISNRYNILKYYSMISTVLLIISLIINFI